MKAASSVGRAKRAQQQPGVVSSIRSHSSPSLFLLFGLWALILTFPLVLHLFDHIPLGAEKVGTVPLFNLWTLQWTVDQLAQGFPNFWDAPIFAPTTGTLAFSETQPLSGLLAAPLWLGLRSPTLGYNALVILFLTLSGWYAYWLLRCWELPVLPALLGGLLSQSLQFVAQEMGVLQLIAIFGILWSLLFLSRFLKQTALDRSAKRTELALALGTPVTFFTCSYYGLASIFFLPLAFLFQLRRKHLRLRTLGGLFIIGLMVLLLTGPLVWAQRQHLAKYGLSRSAQTVEHNSARLEYYWNVLDHNLLYSRLLGLESEPGQRLFPGFGVVLLAGLGVWGGSRRRVKRYLLVATALALMLSLGLRLDIGGFLPYQWLRDHIPGLAQLRSPFRFAAFVQIHLALLAGFGLYNLGRWFSPYRRLILPTVAALVLVELLAVPLPLLVVPSQPLATPWQSWVNAHAVQPRIVMLPFAQTNRVADFERTARWMLANRRLQGDMLNGYSGFFPRDHAQLRDLMLQFPTAKGIELLRAKGVDFVVVYHNLPNAPQPEAIKPFLPVVYQDQANKIAVYRVSK